MPVLQRPRAQADASRRGWPDRARTAVGGEGPAGDRGRPDRRGIKRRGAASPASGGADTRNRGSLNGTQGVIKENAPEQGWHNPSYCRIGPLALGLDTEVSANFGEVDFG